MASVSSDPVSFGEWSVVLSGARELNLAKKDLYHRAIVAYLRYLKSRHEQASLASAKAYIESDPSRAEADSIQREALRWFFKAAVQYALHRPEMDVEGCASPIAV